MSDPQTAPVPAPEPADGVLPRRAALLGGTALVAAAAALRFAAPTEHDDVSPAEFERRRAVLMAALPLRVDPVAPGDVGEALQATGLAGAELAGLQAASAAGHVRMAWIGLFDSDAEDGDIVRIEGGGLSQTVPLRHVPQRIAFVVPASLQFQLTGVDQGTGGGVTVGIVARERTLKLPPLQVGQTMAIPVTIP